MPEISLQDAGFCPHGNYPNQCDACRFEYLHEVKEQAQNNCEKTIEEFGLKNSPTFAQAYEKMKNMNHGPYHQEGGPDVHVSLVLWEMDKLIGQEEKNLTDEEKKILRLSALLHDIGKPESSFVDLPTKKHMELFESSKTMLSPGALDKAQKIRTEILDSMMPGKRSKPKEMDLVRTPEFQNKVEEMLQNEDAEVKRAFVPRFFDHETFSANLLDKITQEIDLKLTPGQIETLKKIIGNHMALYADTTGLEKFIAKALTKDGQFDENTWKMLKMQVRSDSRGTYSYGEPNRDAGVDKLIEGIEKTKIK